MTTVESQAKTIDGRARTVRELLDNAKYAIDFYQRKYAVRNRLVPHCHSSGAMPRTKPAMCWRVVSRTVKRQSSSLG